MFQINLSVNNESSDWFYFIQEVLEIKIKRHGGILATQQTDYRLNISIASENENKAQILDVLRECLCEMYGTIVKLEYIKGITNLKQLKQDSLNILLHTLVAFDRETEKKIIEDSLVIFDGMALDGIFNFTLGELKSRWTEIATLATDNANFLMQEDTLNELLKFLLSAINPKILKLEVRQINNVYNVIANNDNGCFEYKISEAEELVRYLIDIAPLEINLSGSFSDKILYKRLISIFDAKNVENNFAIKKL